jgi:hypothetical protein
LHKDTVAFSSVLGTGLLFIWFAAATSVAAFDAAPAMTQHDVRAANAAHDAGDGAGVVRGLRDQADLKLKGRPDVLAVSRAFTDLFKQM